LQLDQRASQYQSLEEVINVAANAPAEEIIWKAALQIHLKQAV
jgi:hypothetical protein